jgi:hypothetical protein
VRLTCCFSAFARGLRGELSCGGMKNSMKLLTDPFLTRFRQAQNVDFAWKSVDLRPFIFCFFLLLRHGTRLNLTRTAWRQFDLHSQGEHFLCSSCHVGR